MGGRDDEDDAHEADRQRRIADACLNAEPATGRLGLYRRLVQTNLAAVARRLLPRTAATLDSTGGGGFDAWFARFLAEAGASTPYLRDVPGELIAWATPLWKTSTLPPFLGDLARHELDLFDMDAAPGGALPVVTDVTLDRRLVFAEPRRLGRFDYAVHDPGPEPTQRTTYVLVHRDGDNTVHATPLDARGGYLVELALAGVPLDEALTRLAERGDGVADEAARLEVARLLADLAATGALLGGEP